MPDDSGIVINTGPLIALVAATGNLALLAKLYSRVIVPCEVGEEVLANNGTMFGAAEFVTADWLERRETVVAITPLLSQLLDRGEASVIQTALNDGLGTVCIDEHMGRRMARLNGLRVTGTLGLLIRAKREGHGICLSDAIGQMRHAGVFLSDRVIENALRVVGEL